MFGKKILRGRSIRCRLVGVGVVAVLAGVLIPVATASADPTASTDPTASADPTASTSAKADPTLLSDMAKPRNDHMIAFTFDDGPDPAWTPQVLDVLKRNGAVATFCILGSRAVEHPELVRQIVAAGMRLCDHTRTHDEQLATRPTPQIIDEIVGAKSDIRAAQKAPVGYFRAPGGNWAPNLEQIAADNGMRPLGWSVDPRDWSQPGTAAIVDAVEKAAHPGAIVLMHDSGGPRDQTVAALDQLLPWCKSAGYKFGFPTP